MIDIVIPLHSRTSCDHNDLRYALRSIEMFVSGYRDIVIVTDKLPEWIKNIKHIYCQDTDRVLFKERNIATKVILACNDNSITDNFLFTNDDIFITQPFEAISMPYHYKNTIVGAAKECNAGNSYRKTIINTLNTFSKLGLVWDKYYDTHAPMVMNKNTFVEGMAKHDWARTAYGFGMKTLYAEHARVDGDYYPDCKLNSKHTATEIMEIAGMRPYFSIGDGAICDDLWKTLDTLYPKKSKFEK